MSLESVGLSRNGLLGFSAKTAAENSLWTIILKLGALIPSFMPRSVIPSIPLASRSGHSRRPSPRTFATPTDPNARGVCKCVDRQTRLPDCPYCLSSFIISLRAVEVFKRFSLGGISFLPVDVVDLEGNNLEEMVCLIFPMVDVVDMEASQYNTLAEGIAYWFTAPPVLKAEELQRLGLDLLYGNHVSYLCSNRLRCEIEREGLTNFRFEKQLVK